MLLQLIHKVNHENIYTFTQLTGKAEMRKHIKTSFINVIVPPNTDLKQISATSAFLTHQSDKFYILPS